MPLGEIVKRAATSAGGITLLAEQLGIKPSSLYSWRHIPDRWVRAVHEATGISVRELRPDVYGELRIEQLPAWAQAAEYREAKQQ